MLIRFHGILQCNSAKDLRKVALLQDLYKMDEYGTQLGTRFVRGEETAKQVEDAKHPYKPVHNDVLEGIPSSHPPPKTHAVPCPQTQLPPSKTPTKLHFPIRSTPSSPNLPQLPLNTQPQNPQYVRASDFPAPASKPMLIIHEAF